MVSLMPARCKYTKSTNTYMRTDYIHLSSAMRLICMCNIFWIPIKDASKGQNKHNCCQQETHMSLQSVRMLMALVPFSQLTAARIAFYLELRCC